MACAASNPDRPHWWHLAKEIDKEEAQVLMTLGQPVYWWYDCAVANRLRGLRVVSFEQLRALRELRTVLYVPKGLSETEQGES